MSSTDKDALPDVMEEPQYTDAGLGPQGDSLSFDHRTPLGAVRSGSLAPEAQIVPQPASTSSIPRLKRDALRRSDGAGQAAERGSDGAMMMRVATVSLAVGVLVLVAAVIGVSAGEVQTQVGASVPDVEQEEQRTVDGVEVRRGVGTKPEGD